MMIAPRLKLLLHISLITALLCGANLAAWAQPLSLWQALRGFLSENRIVDKTAFERAPYILASASDNLILGAGHEVYVRGEWASNAMAYDVFRLGVAYVDTASKTLLGQEAVHLGTLRIVADVGNGLKKALILSTKEELKAGDRLLARGSATPDHELFRSQSGEHLEGEVIALLDNESKAAQFETVVIDLGRSDGLRVGDVLSIKRRASPVRDPVSKESVALPSAEIGRLLTYKVFPRLSYGIILSLTEPSSVGDTLSTPP